MLKLLADCCVDTSPQHPGGDVDQAMSGVATYVIILSIILGTIVFGLLLYSMIRFRRRDDDEEPPQWHGNTRLEIGWTLVPLFAFLSIFGVTVYNMTTTVASAPASIQNHQLMHVTVIGVQFSWSFDYGGVHKTSNPHQDVRTTAVLTIPDNTPVQLDIVSSDGPCVTDPAVRPKAPAAGASQSDQDRYKAQLANYNILVQDFQLKNMSLADSISDEGCGVNHSFYAPSLAGQMNAIPGQTNQLWLDGTIDGKYYGQCTELCGYGHDGMTFEVDVLSQSDYATWLQQQQGK